LAPDKLTNWMFVTPVLVTESTISRQPLKRIRIYGEASELALDTTPQLLSERRVCPLVITQKGMSTGRTCFNDPSIPTNKTTVSQLVSTWHFKETVMK